MEKKILQITVLLLRLITFLLLVVALIILATDNLKISSNLKITFKNLYAYRYLLGVEAIGCCYILVQTVFAALNISRGAFDSNLRIWFHQISDLVFALFFATGVGSGFGLTVDLKEGIDYESFLVPEFDKFFNLIYASTCLLLLATITMAATILSVAYYVTVR